MKLWGAVWGGLIGWTAASFDGFGLFFGAFLGFVAGLWLEGSIRSLAAATLKTIVDAELKGYIARQIEEALESRSVTSLAKSPSQSPNRAVGDPAFAPKLEPDYAVPPAGQARDEPAQRQQAPAAAPDYEPAAPHVHEPTAIDHAVAAVRGWFLGGNTIVRAGLVILFVGLAFLARYAAQAGLFPIELRLTGIAAAGTALLGVGFNRRVKRPEFGLALQGAGVAVLYLTVFAAAKAFEVMPPLVAFGLMIVIAALGCALALLQDSKAMALASMLGGYAVPVLLGGESPTPLPLFAYLTVLNLAVLAIAWRRSWRSLNLLGFFATLLIASAWAAARYGPQHFMVCQVFLAISVAIYLAAALLYAHNTPGRYGLAADSTLLFGTALAGFGLEMGLVHNIPFGGAYAALAFGAVYVATAAWTVRSKTAESRVLGECLIAIGLGFVTLAVPLALDVKWTSAAWALEGTGAFWVGMRQARWMVRAFGLLLVAVAAMILLATLGPNISAVPLANTATVGTLLIALPLFALAWWLRKPLPHSGSHLAERYAANEPALSKPTFLAAFGFACVALIRELTRLVPGAVTLDLAEPVVGYQFQPLGIAVGVLVLMAIAAWAGRRLDWPVARWPARLALALLAGTLLLTALAGHHVPEWPFAVLWAAALSLHLDTLRREDRANVPVAPRLSHWIHAGTVWLVAAMVADALQLGIDRAMLWDTSWSGVTFLVAVTLMLLALTLWAGRAASEPRDSFAWPLDPRARAYWWTAAVPLAALAYLGALLTAMVSQGVTDPLPYVPLLNPVDLSVALAMAALLLWRRMIATATPRPAESEALFSPFAPAAAAVLGFALVNAIWLRTAHHWLGVEWSAGALAASPAVQLGLAILWTLLAMALMLVAARRASRMVWILGAALLVLVVVKLLLVDMSSAAGWQRIATFIGVGVLMLVIGYFVPLPPRQAGQLEKGQT